MSLYATRYVASKGKSFQHVYTEDEVDFFLGYCQDNDTVYVIPYAECKGRSSLALWVLRKPVGKNDKEIFDEKKWAGAYSLLQ